MLLGIGCTVSIDSGIPAPAIDGVEYQLSWASDGTTPETEGWSVETDLGYRVHVKEGWINNYSVQLVPCPEVARISVGVGVAHAGHPEDADPSAVYGQVQSLTDPTDLWTTLDLDTTSYCSVHYVVGHVDEDSTGLPEEPDLFGVSLWMQGEIVTPEGEILPLEIATHRAHADLLEELALLTTDLRDTHIAKVVVTRNLATLFDGIDFTAAPDDVDWAVLSNLIADLQVEVTVRSR